MLNIYDLKIRSKYNNGYQFPWINILKASNNVICNIAYFSFMKHIIIFTFIVIISRIISSSITIIKGLW